MYIRGTPTPHQVVLIMPSHTDGAAFQGWPRPPLLSSPLAAAPQREATDLPSPRLHPQLLTHPPSLFTLSVIGLWQPPAGDNRGEIQRRVSGCISSLRCESTGNEDSRCHTRCSLQSPTSPHHHLPSLPNPPPPPVETCARPNEQADAWLVSPPVMSFI